MILRLVPAYIEGHFGVGHWKAVRSLDLLLAELGHEVERRLFDPDRWTDALEGIAGVAEQVIVEYSRWPDLVAHLSRRFPGLPVHVRAVNAEAL